MKKTLLCVVVFVMAAILLTSCIELPPEPEHPREFKPYCDVVYEILLDTTPGLPRSFVGYCIEALQTGDESLGAQRFCNYLVELGDFPTVSDCIQDLKNEE